MAVAQQIRRPVPPAAPPVRPPPQMAAPPVRGLTESAIAPRAPVNTRALQTASRNNAFDANQQQHTSRMQNLEYIRASEGQPQASNSYVEGPWSYAPPQAAAQEQEQPIDYNALRTLMATATPAQVAAPNPEEDRRISESAFARAKDNAGLLALRRSADARTRATAMGQTGGGAEIAAQSAIEGDVVDNLTGVAQAQAEQEAARRYGVADRNYAGAIQQRGQNISLTPSLLSLYQQSRRRY